MGALRCWIALCALEIISCCLGISAQNVTLESLAIFRTHEWLGHKPSLYFKCRDENKVDLPDVKEKDRIYKFAGHESWQPLTSLVGVRCKRCGVYEKNEFLKDGVFDEWELCPDDFDKSGRYFHFKKGEFNATFLQSLDAPDSSSSNDEPQAPSSGHGRAAITALVALFSFLMVAGLGIVGYTKWQQKKREEQQARFIKLFEEDDDFERELGL
ncbi:hypothetical protein SELMODRAFT_271734 [Selaginella moellendorffii]|uniref:DUF7953 domain-containing protein n=1 Tax=Selaginella moellendorffii TaxID=88036 RepID=D8SNL2_SELML|nr:uncharacterized protein LOC9648760 isoform X1 [Selaginella moellendorffii]EFJ14192.1 hypothetical protein SELMODRAFT_271734 [Selaginella moellendorffii]|eukprot:XP_002984942.1 uncharacterized protein LOC9648760 isoform X1 [Selaginella moellendorffii]